MKKLLVILATAALAGCGNQIPDTFSESAQLPRIYPDYTNVTVPVNIAPLTFEADSTSDGIVARLTAGDEEVVCGGSQVFLGDSQGKLRSGRKCFDLQDLVF